MISDINIYRDGGSIEFTLESEPKLHVWLNTPFDGEPKELRINGFPVKIGDPLIFQTLGYIENWVNAMDPRMVGRVTEVLAKKKPYYNPDAETKLACIYSHVISVRNYIICHYIQ